MKAQSGPAPVARKARDGKAPEAGEELVAKHGAAERDRIARGLRQAGEFWRPSDGNDAAFADFVRTNFAGDAAARDALFARLELAMETLDGHMLEIGRDFRRQSDLDLGPIRPFDETLAGYDPSAHVSDDFFANKLAFTVLLNFPLTTLDERLAAGETWSRRQWAEARLAQRFGKRIPAEVNLAIGQAASDAARYIAEYNIWMHHVVDGNGARLFPAGMRLLSHWNLRDEIKSDYADAKNGLAKQRTIQKVMERIVTQTIPGAAVDNPGVDWNPFTNDVRPAAVKDSDRPLPPGRAAPPGPEPDTRYARLLEIFRACRKADPYSPTAPTLIARRFDEDREIPEARFREMLEKVLSSPLVPRVAKLVAARLGRPLEPFDVWYSRLPREEPVPGGAARRDRPQAIPDGGGVPEGHSRICSSTSASRRRSPAGSPTSRSTPPGAPGTRWEPGGGGTQAHLRTRVEKNGMNYKGFNIAVHEMGHTVEQTFSLNSIDHTLLQGVPNNAFTEGARVRLPGARPRASGSRAARREEPRLEDAERLLGDVRDRRRGARRHGRLALDVRASRTRRRRS